MQIGQLKATYLTNLHEVAPSGAGVQFHHRDRVLGHSSRFSKHPKVKSDGQECPPHTNQSIPNSLARAFHLPSTNALVFASITISSGHGRVKPSVAHFRVASMPILEP